MTLSRVIEALLFSAQKPLSIRELAAAIKGAGAEDELSPNEFARATEGWQLVTDPAFVRWVRRLFPAPKPARLTAPALETLAIIAYRQPITRADVEAVRGVNIDGVLQTLMERGLVKIAGRAEIPGRPLLYETTQFFLDHFGLRTLDELPNVEELRKRYLPVSARSQPAVAGVADARPQSKESSASDQTAPASTS